MLPPSVNQNLLAVLVPQRHDRSAYQISCRIAPWTAPKAEDFSPFDQTDILKTPPDCAFGAEPTNNARLPGLQIADRSSLHFTSLPNTLFYKHGRYSPETSYVSGQNGCKKAGILSDTGLRPLLFFFQYSFANFDQNLRYAALVHLFDGHMQMLTVKGISLVREGTHLLKHPAIDRD